MRANVVAMWFIIFFSFLSLACLRWGVREMKRGGNQSIKRASLLFFVLFAIIAIVIIVNYVNGTYSEM